MVAERRGTEMEKVAAEADLAVGLGQNRGGDLMVKRENSGSRRVWENPVDSAPRKYIWRGR